MADFTVMAEVVLWVQAPPSSFQAGTTAQNPHNSCHLCFATEGAVYLHAG